MTRWSVLLWLLLLLPGCSGGAGPSSPSPVASTPLTPDIEYANESHPGEEARLGELAVAGKTTLIEFYSDSCPACAEMATVMSYLSRNKENLAIRKVNIDRRGSDRIDFESPLAEQWQVESVPSFLVFDEKRQLVARGDEAKDRVRAWYQEAQLGQAAEQNPDLAAPYRASPAADEP